MATTAGTKRAQPFAHLLGGLMGRVTGAKADDGPDEPKKENQDDEKNLEGDDDASAKGAKAEGDDDDEKKGPDDAGADDGDDDEKKDDDDEPAGKKARKAKADDEGDDESAKSADAAYRAGRKAERARCRAIFNSPAAGARPDIAANLAFNTGLSSANAIAMLETTVQGTAAFATVSARSGLGERMASHPIPNVGAGNGGVAPNLAQQIVAANNKRLGITQK